MEVKYVLTGIKFARVDCISSISKISFFGVYLPTAFIHLSKAQYSSFLLVRFFFALFFFHFSALACPCDFSVWH